MVAKANAGQGTLGKLLNDPRAFEALVADLAELNRLLKTGNRIAEQLEEEGVKVRIF